MNRGTRLAIVAGIIVAIAGVATYIATSSAPSSESAPPTDNGNTTNSEPRQITVELDESLSFEDVGAE